MTLFYHTKQKLLGCGGSNFGKITVYDLKKSEHSGLCNSIVQEILHDLQATSESTESLEINLIICDLPWQNQACFGRLMNGDTGKNQCEEGDFF